MASALLGFGEVGAAHHILRLAMPPGAQQIDWLGHAGFRIKTRAGTVYIDPYRTTGSGDADVILITHDHFDHFSREDVLRLAGKRTTLIGPATVTEQLKGKTITISPGDAVEVDELEITAIPAYNTNKLDSEGRPFHSRDAGWVGYLLRDGARRIYHSGDTDVIPEMDQASGVDVALLPVSGTYVMTAVEAAEAARRIDPQVAVPMHWGTVIGSEEDARAFASAARSNPNIQVVILERTG
jgi:L-ascorbate metabolism protein UlaG (beta-lactamase superfamily)